MRRRTSAGFRRAVTRGDIGRWTWIGLGMAVTALFLLLSGSVFFVPPSVDKETNCREDQAPKLHVVVLVDRTDPLTKLQTDNLRKIVLEEARRLPRHEWLSIYTITQTTDVSPIRVFSYCNPGRAPDAKVLVETAERIQQLHDTNFKRPLDVVLDEFTVASTHDQSPIVGSIEAISRLEPFTSVGSRRLVIVSDMLEHTAGFSHYRRIGGYDQIYRAQPYRDLKPNLAGTVVVIHQVGREKFRANQGPEHRLFWRLFFQRFGATLDGDIRSL
ncbi:MAG: hypothetical protein FJX46_07985 [Alphaproteobacteria bacterium]|nr:hypothetical protein [Alphaproteobacteria bacterium]